MRHSTLLASTLAVGSLALPQGQLEKRQQVTVYSTVTVTVTVFANPIATPAWAGPPKAPNPPNPNRPSFAPSLPLWTPPRPDAGRTTSSTPRASSSTAPVVSVPGATQGPIGGGQPTGPAVPGNTQGVPGVATSGTSIVGSAISNAPVPSNAAPTPAPGGAPLDPGHTPGVGQATLSAGLAYQNAILYHHNAARANHNAAPLVWNQTVANTAAIAANTCRFEHLIPAGVNQGQNLFTVSGNYFNVTAGITESWYKGEFQAMLPVFGQPSIPAEIFHDVGHLTQILWKGTTSVGCVSLDCGNRMVVGGQAGSTLNKYTVCNYYPAGNVGTQYAINVGRPISNTNLGSWSN
ncbi:PR-1-like protein [Didymella exigua CBS 183.55]|uniref:PR-1-like protein n=1 Tax=Didymella exigua CBS 183.55 TaxID=1150837 RepID=A0A6A5RFZ2_9PLEO|nr:PR-1-like protein [Didymella exigua CBS 183.55]KAF1926672.1 PR-1-like protein [Didymella exigua CBS 183.55]